MDPMKRTLALVFCLSLSGVAFADAGLSEKNGKLIEAARDGNLAAVQSLLNEGASPNDIAINDNGFSALCWASFNGHIDIVKLLLEKGAKVDNKPLSNRGHLALNLAAAQGYTELVKILLDNGADVNAMDDFDKTALMDASYWN